MKERIKLEDMIREIDQEQRQGPPLDLEKIAQKAEWEIERRKLIRRKKQMSIVAAASILAAIIVVSFGNLALDSGYADNFRQMFSREVSTDNQNKDNFIDGESKETLTEKEMALEELKEALPFEIAMPQYLPEGFALDRCSARILNDKYVSAKIYFINFETRKMITYQTMSIENRRTQVDALDIEEYDTEDKEYNGITYTFANSSDKEFNVIYWAKEEQFFTMQSDEAVEELLKMAYSMDMEGDDE